MNGSVARTHLLDALGASLPVGPNGEPLVKSQQIRLLDVFVIGPLMAYGATRMPLGPASVALGFFGATTVWYNARNYLRVRKWEDERSPSAATGE